MNIFRKYKNLWMFGIVIVVAILFIVNFSVVVSGVQAVWNSISSLLAGAAMAFVLNLIMDPIEGLLKKTKHPFWEKHARSFALAAAFLIFTLIIILLLSIVIPNLISALQVLTKEAPGYFDQLEDFIKKILDKYPLFKGTEDALNINWTDTTQKLMDFVSKGLSGAMNSTVNLVSGAVSATVNLFVIVVFAIYVLSEKERFTQIYYFFANLYLKPERKDHLTRDLRIINQSFKAFVGGEIIEAGILSTMCVVGMLILQLPYATMIGILVGVINMIPMVGAFIGGGIGAFIIFTISPAKCLVFLVFLIIIQQIESNIFFPRIIGNRVGLPGIYVMITIVVGGSLFGVAGMILGVPLMASLYKILKLYFEEQAAKKKKKDSQKDSVSDTDEKGTSSTTDRVLETLKKQINKAETALDGSKSLSDEN